ncbi:MAG: glycosyltransferase [Muribaculaceae bacterium]|nr:glycosyltransferase [Muribaculaceae bacterium]
MKVLYIASGTNMAGGATKSLITMLLQAKAHGIEFEVVCPDEKGLTQWLRENGITVHVVHFRHVRLPFFRSLSDKIKWLPRVVHDYWINYRARSGVERIAREFAPDIIHENTSVINVGYHAAKSIGVPDVIHIREYGNLKYRISLPGRTSRIKAENVFTIPITKDLSRFLNQESNPNTKQLYDGIVSISEFRINEDKEKWFLYAGRIESSKGIGDLLEAYAEYVVSTSTPYPLYVCGGCNNSAYLEELKAFTIEKGIESNVKWMGERDDVSDFMAKAAATIIPSRNEGLGRVMPEAMANGSLCVARYKLGTKEQLDNGIDFTGAPIAIAYEEKNQLKEALLNITEAVERGEAFISGSDYRKMIDRSQAAVKEFFSEESFGDKLHNFYIDILKLSKSSR